MSFSNSRYSSSPASLQRDYALLQGNSYTPFSNQNTPLSEEEDEDQDQVQAQGSSSNRDTQDEEDDDISNLTQSRDNLSQLSLPGIINEPNPQSTSQSKSKRNSSNRSNHLDSPPTLKATLSQSSSELSRSRGRGGSNLLRNRSSSSNHHNHSFSPTKDKKREFPNYLLGGDPVIPPKEADLRSAEEIEDERIRLQEQENDSAAASISNLSQEDEDQDETPMPNSNRKSWLEITDLNGRSSSSMQKKSSKTSISHETTPLLSSSVPIHSHGISHPTIPSESGFSNFSNNTGARGRAFSHGGVGNAANPSGWNTNLLAEPNPPGIEHVAAIVHHPTSSPARREFKVLVLYSLPIWGTHVLELSLNMASVLSLGHLGTLPLAAASLSSMTANVTGYSIVSGFVSALDSLLPSAFTSQPKMVGLWTQRMVLVIAALLVPIIITWLNAESILLSLGQDSEVSRLSGVYLKIAVWGLPPYAIFEICRRYLQAQGLMHAPTLVLFIAAPLNVFLNWLLVWGPPSFRLGFIGSPLASVISTYLMAILCCVQCYLAPRTAWGGLSKNAFSYAGIMTCVSLGGASTLGLCAEWWSWEIVGLMTSKFGTTALAAQSVLLVSSSLTYQSPFALSVAIAVRIGNLLGASLASTAALSARTAMLLSLIVGAMNSSLFLIFRPQWGYIFSSDEEVVQLVYDMIPILAGFQLADGISGVAGGIMRGTGRQGISAIMNLVGYYVFGIPIGILLAFQLKMGLLGLWAGLTLALALGSISLSWWIIRTDWDEEVRKVHRRMGMDNEYVAKPVDDEGEAGVSNGYGATSQSAPSNPET